MTVVSIPDYDFSGFYYPEILRSLLAYLKVNTPELTSEAPEEPHIQFMRAFSLVGHLNNVRLDIVANELMLDSCSLRESMRRLFRLIGYKLASATPAVSEVVIELSITPEVDQTSYIPNGAQFSTEEEEGPDVLYEVTEDKAMDRGDMVSHVFSQLTSAEPKTDGVVDTFYPTRFYTPTSSFSSGDIGKTLMIDASVNGNHGWFTITNFIDAYTVEVADANFITESDLTWKMVSFSVDYATDANDPLTTFIPWADFNGQECFYIGHNHIQWDQLDVTLTAPGTRLWLVWEYYDPTYSKEHPSTVTDGGGYIDFSITALSGSARVDGMVVKVTYNQTGKSEVCKSTYSGGLNLIRSTGILGQITVDTNPLNYTIQADWIPLTNISDGTVNLENSGVVTYKWPMTSEVRWTKATINGEEAYYLRCRLRDDADPNLCVSPTVALLQVNQGKQYFPFEVVQGTTVTNEVIGSSNGLQRQSFQSLQGPVFDDSFTLEVDETGGSTWVPWVPKANLLRSSSTDRHYKWDYTKDGNLVVTFGDGANGKIPPLGTNNVRLSKYRIGGEKNGNVGSFKISNNIDSISYVSAIGNPMPALGWKMMEAGDAVDFEKMKDVGPASIRNSGKATSTMDIPSVAVNEYKTADGSSLIARAYAIEEAFGPKTVKLVVVGTGGNYLTDIQLKDVEKFFNGDRYTYPPEYGVLLCNTELTAVNYEPKKTDVSIHVIGKGVTVTQVKNALNAYLDPLSVDDDGNYVHDFGGMVAVVMLDCAISKISPHIKNIQRTIPSSDITLGPNELPVPGTFTVTVSET